MLNRIWIGLVLLLAAAGAWPAAAQDASTADEVRALLQERDREIKDLLGDKDTFTVAQREELKAVINEGIDFEAMSVGALGPHWDNLSAEQRAGFVDVFSEIVRSESLSNLEIYRLNVTYKDVTVEGDSAYAVTTTVYKDQPFEVAYVLGHRDDAWRVDDIILDEVSTVGGYARSFQTAIRKRGFDALMESLNKRLDKMNASE